MRIRFDLATNFDDELLKRVSELNAIKSVYGKLREDIVGGGRPNYTLPDVSRKRLKEHIQVAHNNGILFNYLLNALCMDNREFIGKTNRQIRDFLRFIEDSGTDFVTVGSPFLLRLVKEHTAMKVSISIYNDIDSTDKVREWERLGADELTLHYSYNRNFKKLEEVLKLSKVDFRLIANNVCLHECIYRTNHANALAHSSQTSHESGGFFLDYFSLNCGKEKIKNPVKLIAADWIRPEDIHFYEELCDKLDVDNLTLKLTDRSRSTDWLANVASAYASRRYDGNIFDILNYIGNKGYAQIHKGSFIKGAVLQKADAFKMREFQKAVFLTPAFADNRALDGFMDFFLNHDCSKYHCDDEGWPSSTQKAINSCSYCRSWAQKTLQFPEGEESRAEAISKCETLLHDFESGGIF